MSKPKNQPRPAAAHADAITDESGHPVGEATALTDPESDDAAPALADAGTLQDGDGGVLTIAAAKPYPAGYMEALQTALEIASTDLVNMEVAAAHLAEQFPGEFASVTDAAEAIAALAAA